MSAPRPAVDPAMQAWIDEQKRHFKPSDLDGVVRLMRSWERADRKRAQRDAA